jgi:hypothetical protein
MVWWSSLWLQAQADYRREPTRCLWTAARIGTVLEIECAESGLDMEAEDSTMQQLVNSAVRGILRIPLYTGLQRWNVECHARPHVEVSLLSDFRTPSTTLHRSAFVCGLILVFLI